jgi:hypothetical protein
MATTETKALDDVISSRRALILGGSALAGLFLSKTQMANAASTVTTFTDNDILNFALNLEYLEANYYYLAAFGTTIYAPNPGYPAGGMMQGITGTGTQGTVTTKTGSTKVPFTTTQVGSYAIETAIEEGKHVNFLRTALGSAAVSQPAINLDGGAAGTATNATTAAWNVLANAAGIGPTFDPFVSDATFLVGAYVFEDVGVTAYHGAAPKLSATARTNGVLAAAAGILAVEAYHAGLVRTSIKYMDNANNSSTLTGYTTMISALRSKLSLGANSGMNYAGGTTADDNGLSMAGVTYNLEGTSMVGTSLVDADVNEVAYARSTTQVLNIVTGGGSATAGTKATGVFFPAGLNGTFS